MKPASTPSAYFPAVTVTDERGDLPGLLIGKDDSRAVVAVRRENAPMWFQEQYVSAYPHLWFPLDKVHLD